MRAIKTPLLLVALAVVTLAAPPTASAFEGVVRGRLQFYNNQGNFCPSFRDCTDARYLQSEFNTVQPIRTAKVYLVDDRGNRIGQSTTDSGGRFRMKWSSPLRTPRAHVEWYGEHREGRYSLRRANGSRTVMLSPNRFLVPGTSASSPQILPDVVFGSSALPHSLSNLYDGAWRM